MNTQIIKSSVVNKKARNTKARVVNIIGRAPSGEVQLPYGENWLCNHAWSYQFSADKLFMMDGVKPFFDTLVSENHTKEDFSEFLVANPNIEILNAYPEQFRIDGEDKIYQCTALPLKYLSSLIPGNFSNNSITWMIMYALVQEQLGFQKVEFINLLGCELWFSFENSEYNSQRPCLDFWIPYCYGRGVQMYVPAYTLYAKGLEGNMYGYVR